MIPHDLSVPFFATGIVMGFNPGKPFENPKQEVAGIRKAIGATRKRIADYRSGGANVSDLEFHLKNLEQRLQATHNKTR